MDAPDSEYLSFNAGFRVSTPCCNLPADVLDRWRDGREWSYFVRFADDSLVNVAFRLAGSEPRTLLPELALMRPIASAADPVASFSACCSASALESLSHQNSHARESRDRPLADRRNEPTALSRVDRVRSKDETPEPWLLLNEVSTC